MNIPIRAALMVLSALPLAAQVEARLNRPIGRSPEIAIRNTAALNLTALAVTMAPVPGNDTAGGPFTFFADAAIDTHWIYADLPVAPNDEYVVPVNTGFRGGRMVELYVPPVTVAAIFEDGTTAGDPALLARLISRRSTMLQAVELTRDLLAEAGRHNIPRSQLVEQFQALAESVSHWYLPPEQTVGRTLYRSMAEDLLNLTQGRLGSAFPPGTFVAQEVAKLNRQRTALLESRPALEQATALQR